MNEPKTAEELAWSHNPYHNISHAEAAEAHDRAARRGATAEDHMAAMEATERTPETDPDIQDDIDNVWSCAVEDTDGEHERTKAKHHRAIAAAHRRAASTGARDSPLSG